MKVWTVVSMLVLGVGLSRAQDAPSAPVVQTAPPTPPSIARLSGGVMAGNIKAMVPPVYPPDAKRQHVEGSVVLHAIIGKKGAVEKLVVISGSPLLSDAAIDAVRRWTYKPYLLNGQPVEVDTTITVNFNMGSGPQRLPTAPLVLPPPPPLPPPPATPAVWEKTPGVLRLSSGTMAAQLISKVDPAFPEDAEPGTVELGVTVGADGSVEKALVLAGPPELRDLSIEAVRQWKYKPYVVDGAPVKVETRVTLNFGEPAAAHGTDVEINSEKADSRYTGLFFR